MGCRAGNPLFIFTLRRIDGIGLVIGVAMGLWEEFALAREMVVG